MKMAANMKRIYYLLSILVLSAFITDTSLAQNYAVVANQTADTLAAKLTGAGVIVLNPSLNCAQLANGTFNGVSNLGIDSGIVLTSGHASATAGPVGGPSFSNNFPGDPDLTNLAGNSTHDACILEFDFVPSGDTVKFNYVFGSVEYTGYSCSGYNDAFGFFISGPDIPTPTNIALIPGTNIPVAVNSTTDPVVNNVLNLGPCQAMGPGSPFAQYYVNNNAGIYITYAGFTEVFTAISPVTACDTYHLKLAVGDAGDFILDSGVWLEAGSLTSGTTSIATFGPGGLPYVVRGCAPGKFVFTRPVATPLPKVVHFQIGGTAINGYDYVTIADSAVIPADSLTDTVYINALPVIPPAGPKTVKLYILSPYLCNGNQISDSAEITIYDSLYLHVISPDTPICIGNSVHILAEGDSILNYHWTPSTGLDDPNILSPTATPTTTTTYSVTAELPGSGCPSMQGNITIDVKFPPTVDLGPDVTTCVGVPVPLNAVTTPLNQTYTYSWSPATYLSDAAIQNPVSTPTVQNDVTYVVTADPGAVGCARTDTITIHELPNDFALLNPDTVVCVGGLIQVRANGDPNFSYTWSPSTYVSNPFIIDPQMTPDTSITYTITATYPGCPDMIHSFNVEVQPNPVVNIPDSAQMCQWQSIIINATVDPPYPNYTYAWTPNTGLDNYNTPDIVFTGDSSNNYILTVTTPNGCKGSDSTYITVFPGNFGGISPSIDTNICPLDSVYLHATGGVFYSWTPNDPGVISDSLASDPLIYPYRDTRYEVLITDVHGCHDTLDVKFFVHSNAIIDIPDSVRLYPGESYQMNPQGNVMYYHWFPPTGLSDDDISNPVSMPEVTTKYIVKGTTEWGCPATDSIKVIVDPESVLDIPNAFVPGSGPNSELKIVKRGIATLKNFRIFNRWGNVVFETSDINQGWDGKYKGEPQPFGVYVYTIEAYTNTGLKFVKQGNVTLIR
ncbi:MAG: hypothetical protein BGO69_14290 [Bacteroidetes bacterium 46-16]|nr:MAG: hypothetical protein BGO69_14290 [Bacteroidetes bacterium 46-16]